MLLDTCFLRGQVWRRNRLLISVSKVIDTSVSADGCHNDKADGRSLGVAEIAVKLENVFYAVDFLTGGVWFRNSLLHSVSRGNDTPVSCDGCHGDRLDGKSFALLKLPSNLKTLS